VIIPPSSCKQLLDHGFQLTVERSSQRFFKDSEYEAVGCRMVAEGSWESDAPLDALIAGLKELPESDAPLKHRHIFFAHCFKTQAGWKELLDRFHRGGGKIFDLEFLQDERGRRVAAFGYHAGFNGAAFGIDMWAEQQLNPGKPYPAITPFVNEQALVEHVRGNLEKAVKVAGRRPVVLVMGALGRCGTGAVEFAQKVGLGQECILQWDMAETARGGPFNEIVQSDIFVNCIYLSKPIPPFITQAQLDGDRRLTAIVDVSCDTTNPHNPIPIYTANTTFDQPTMKIPTSNVKPLDLMAIDHLPTALPRESSEQFCRDLMPYLLQLHAPEASRVWSDALQLFEEKCALAVAESQS